MPLFVVTDAAIPAGAVGLYAWNNPGAVFREVLVTKPRWTTYYTFSEEAISPAGTKLRVFSGNASASPAPTDNVGYRFAAEMNDPGTSYFDSDNVELRLVSPHGSVVHARGFLPDTAYSPVAARLLRRADGTAFAVIVPSAVSPGTSLQPGQYRLAVTYWRDNRAAAPPARSSPKAAPPAPKSRPWTSPGQPSNQGRPGPQA